MPSGFVTPAPGGGSQPPLHVVTVTNADVLPNQLGDGSAAAPLLTVPAGALLTVRGVVVTETFDDSGVTTGALQVVDGADSESFGDLSSIDPSAAAPVPSPGPSGAFTYTANQASYAPASLPVWLLFVGFAFDGNQGSVDVILQIERST